MYNKFVVILILAHPFNSLYSQHNYELALNMSTRFLGAQRCGDSESWLHGDCHLEDGQVVGLNLTGGWHDCGDHIKFSHTGPFTAAILLLNYVEYPQNYPDNYSSISSAPPSNGIPDILDEIKYETDFLINSIHNNVVYYQVGDGTDHNSFSEPVYQSEYLPVSEGGNPRNVYSITQGGSNICGESCAALALMSIAYAQFDQAYSTLCMQKALEYYQIGNIYPSAIPSTSNNGTEFYPADNWADDMAFAALSLFKASNDVNYLNDAIGFHNNTDFYVEDWYPMTYLNVNQLINLELYLATGSQVYLTAFEDHLTEMYSFQTDCGYMHFADWGSLNYASNEAFLAFKYYNTTFDSDAWDFGKSNIDFILGSHIDTDNSIPDDFSFLIGYNQLGGGYPQYPHHAGAFGYGEDAWDLFTQEEADSGSVPYQHELTGALVGGPGSPCGDYVDNIGDYVSNEVCIYYNAGLINALALVNSNIAVAIELTTLHAKWVDNAVHVKWSTATEHNNAGFFVQRMHHTDAHEGNWSNIAWIEGQGNRTLTSYYNFIDASAVPGVNYYRLLQKDYADNEQLSATVQVTVPSSGRDWKICMNPTHTEMWVVFPTNIPDVNLGVYDMCGRLLLSHEYPESNSSDKINLAGLPAGVYIVTLRAGGDLWNHSLVKR